MIVEQIWTGNSYRNFNYLIVCPETGEALAVDPVDHKKCLALAKEKGWEITQILNTHEHGDHIGGNAAMVKATGAQLIAHENAKDSIPGIDRGLSAGDVVKVGKTVELLALDTPGHTMSHVCLLSQTDTPLDRYLQGDKSALSEKAIQGMELFNGKANCIECHNGPMLSDQKYYNLGVPRPIEWEETGINTITYRFELYAKGVPEKYYREFKDDPGLYFDTKRWSDLGKFRTQPLRYLVYTPPYMHAG